MEKQKDSRRSGPRDSGVPDNLNISDEALEEKMEKEKAAEERRKDERRKTYRRESDRILAEERDGAVEENARLKEELDSLRDVMLRRQADFENYKKRVVRQHADARVMTIRDFAGDIIAINDDLIRAVEASESIGGEISAEDAHRSFVEGVSMISKRIEEAMGRYGVTEIEALNRPFDPNFHEAVEIEMSDDVDCDTVARVYLKGFRIDDLVVRSARVKVAKPKKGNAPSDGSAGEGDGDGEVH
ncbi:MAG: nucleotide exchange factor GrpE [Spirochaetes bacterium]|nr:nucleotide exchange factor GrpE [Spirochaetota bacterium]